MRRLSGWLFVGAACTALAACGGDLTVDGNYQPGYTCSPEGVLGLKILAKITNQGPGSVKLAGDWTKPWLSMSASVELPGWVRPIYTGKATELKPGDSVALQFDYYLPRAPDGVEYDLIFEVNPSHAYAETNDSNNTDTIAVPAQICG